MTDTIIYNIMRIMSNRRQFYVQHFEPLGLAHGQWILLRRICENPGIYQESLTKMVNMDKGNLARKLADMEEKGLIERTVSQKDRRAAELYPAEAGKALLPEILKVDQAWRDYILEGLTSEQCTMLENITEHMKTRSEQIFDQYGSAGSQEAESDKNT